MRSEITIGIDLATKAPKTGLAVINWGGKAPQVIELTRPAGDDRILQAAQDYPGATIAIDCPFGWPAHFSDYVASVSARRSDGYSPPEYKADHELDTLRYRTTDHFVRDTIAALVGKKCAARPVYPLSVAMDKIGATAFRCQQILEMLHNEPVLGDLIEVYPAASLSVWNHDARVRFAYLLKAVGMTLAEPESKNAENDHCRDAIVCAMSARAYDKGVTYSATEHKHPVSEGWIELPQPGSLARLPGS